MARTKQLGKALEALRARYVKVVGKEPPRNQYGKNEEWLKQRILEAEPQEEEAEEESVNSDSENSMNDSESENESGEESEVDERAIVSQSEDESKEVDDAEQEDSVENNEESEEEEVSGEEDEEHESDNNDEDSSVSLKKGAVNTSRGNFSFLSLLKPQDKPSKASSKWNVKVAKSDRSAAPSIKSFKLSTSAKSGEIFQLERGKRSAGRKASLTQEVRDSLVEDSVSKIGRGKGEKQDQATRMKKNWHGMEAPVMTEELKQTLRALQLRSYMDPKRFYKAADSKKPPTYFQMGTVVEGLGEFKTGRLKRKERKQTFIDEVLGDQHVRKYAKRVFNQIQEVKQQSGKKRFAKKKKRRY